MMKNKSINILLVEDNPGDVRLTKEALKFWKNPANLESVENGVEAMAYLNQEGKYIDAPTPDLIMLDLNLPMKNGFDVLNDMKIDPQLRMIPVIILTSSCAKRDIERTYGMYANCYITKPQTLDAFIDIMQNIEIFWFEVALIPGRV